MISLSDQLRESASHGRLPHHRDCPICRAERLGGSLAGSAILGRRGQAGFLAATLAISSLALPSAALAQSNGTTSLPAQIPDGALDRLDSDDGTQPDMPAAEDDAPVAGERLIDRDPDNGSEAPDPTPLSELGHEQPGEEAEPTVDHQPESRTAPTPPATREPETVPVPAPPAPPPPAVPPAATPTAPVASLEDRGAADAGRPNVRHLRLEIDQVRTRGRAAAAPPAPSSTPPPKAELAPPPAPAEQTTVTTDVHEAASVPRPVSAMRAPAEGDSYTVRPGDSLWSIARRLLGAEASAGKIAPEVNRLWELNRERIATGDPDLLRVGTELQL